MPIAPLTCADNSEDVRIGKVLHEISEEKVQASVEIKIDNVKEIDKLTKEYLVELKGRTPTLKR